MVLKYKGVHLSFDTWMVGKGKWHSYHSGRKANIKGRTKKDLYSNIQRYWNNGGKIF